MRYTILAMLLGPVWTGAGTPADDAAKKDLERFQGSWRAVAVQNFDGQPAPDEDVKHTRLQVEGNRFTLTGKNFKVSGTFTIDSTKTPKTIDVLLEGAATKEERFLGIYQIEGDDRKSCFALQGKERPSDFRTGVKGILRLEWKR
jgi:uncharacterized protein (TIGR03067 family)